jgi:hypothetical protein
MAGFVLYLLDHFGLRCRVVELCSKAPIINLPAGNVEGDRAMKAASSGQHSAVSENQPQNSLTAKDAENAKKSKQKQHQEDRGRTAGGGCATRASLKPTPLWDDLGCGGIPRRGVGDRRNRKNKTLPRINADERRSERKNLPLMNADRRRSGDLVIARDRMIESQKTCCG